MGAARFIHGADNACTTTDCVGGPRSKPRSRSYESTLAQREFGALLGKSIDEAGLSNTAVALRVGVSEGTVRHWRAGRVAFPIHRCVALPTSVALRFVAMIAEQIRNDALPYVRDRLPAELDPVSVARALRATGEAL